MERPCITKHNSSLLVLMLLLSFMVGWIEGVCMEDERKALLEIKASLREIPYFSKSNFLGLSTWVGNGTSGECCDWERITCDPTTGYITDLYLSDITSMEYDDYSYHVRAQTERSWPLNFSSFAHFKELRSLDLSWNYINNTKGLERLGSLKKLEILNLSTNCIETNIFPSLGALTSLKILDLSLMNVDRQFPPAHDISEFSSLENLELLDLSGCGYNGSFQRQGSESISTLRKLKILNLNGNYFNESIITSLSSLPSLTVLDLSFNRLTKSFPSQGCKSFIGLQRLESISLSGNSLNQSIISCLNFLPSLKILDLSYSPGLGSSFPMQELSSLRQLHTLDLSSCGLESLTSNDTMSNLLHLTLDDNFFLDDIMRSMTAFPSLRFLSSAISNLGGRLFTYELPNLPDLEVLLLSENYFNGTLPIEALASFHHLEVIDLSDNQFVGSIPSTIKLSSSLKVVSFAYNNFHGLLSDHWLCELKNLQVLDLSHNMFDGNMPECFNKLSSLKFIDISSNQFTGVLLPSSIANLTSLEYVDFSHNKFEGSFSFSLFSHNTKLEFVAFASDNDKFEVETEEPIGWTPMFQLKVLVLSNCRINKLKGSILPSFLLHQNKLRKLDMSHSSLEGQFPNWLITNNTWLEVLNLSNNSFGNMFCVSPYMNPNTRWMDLSGNYMIGPILGDIKKALPHIRYLNLSRNSLDGVIPTSFGDLGALAILDLSHNKLYGEVPIGLFTNLSSLSILILSNNSLHGKILAGNSNLPNIERLQLDRNCFNGKIGNMSALSKIRLLDISNNFFIGSTSYWISNNTLSNSLVFLDVSQNYFTGPILSCLNLQYVEHLHLGSNRFTGSIPSFFRNLTSVLTLDMGNNDLSGRIPNFLGEISSVRILLMGKNNFIGPIPRQLCQLTNVSLIDLSSNFLSGSIPDCLQIITGHRYKAFMDIGYICDTNDMTSNYHYSNGLDKSLKFTGQTYKIQDKVTFTTKSLSLAYKGDVLDIMSGLDLSSNKLTGDIPEELGLLSQIHVLNLSHNRLTGPIPVKFSNLVNIESLDLSCNSLTGKVPSELTNLSFLEVFNVSYNNLSGRLPEMKAQFSTFTKESFEGNPLLCGPQLENKCTMGTEETRQLFKEENDEKWYDMDMTSFYGSFGSTWFVSMCGFATLLWVNPYWRRRWLDLVEECMYTCYYFLYDSVRKVSMHLFK